MQQGWRLKALKPTIIMFEHYMMFYLKMEESMLIEHEMSVEDLEVMRE